jgi:multiple antibiotic resistance protein
MARREADRARAQNAALLAAHPSARIRATMALALTDLAAFALSTLTTLFFVVDAPAAVPMFLSMTLTETPEERRRTALRTSIAAFCTLSAFAALGGLLFELLGISLGAFRIAGGILLFLLAIDMLRAQRSRQRSSPEELAEGVHKEDVSIFPLAIPMLAGPGATSTVMVLVSRGEGPWHFAIVGIAITITAASVYWILRSANLLEKRLGYTGMNVLERVMGLILAATAVQFVIEGVLASIPLVAP